MDVIENLPKFYISAGLLANMTGGTPGKVVNQGIRIGWTCWKNTLQFSRCLEFCCWFFGGWFTRWWFQIFAIFTPTWGHDPIWLVFFQMGWFNHQPVYDVYPDQRAPSKTPTLHQASNFSLEGDYTDYLKSRGFPLLAPTAATSSALPYDTWPLDDC